MTHAPKTTPKDVLEALSMHMAANRITQSELAKATGESPCNISRWLNGRRGIQLSTFILLVTVANRIVKEQCHQCYGLRVGVRLPAEPPQ